jgi:hypothetical protein
LVDQDVATKDFRNAPPIFSALEQKKATLNRQKKLAQKTKPLNTYILGI